MLSNPSLPNDTMPTNSETVVGNSLKIDGDLISDGDIRIEGEVKGSVSTKGDVFVGSQAIIKANINAKNADINGTVTGDISALGKLTLGESARIKGNINSNTLEIRSGAQFSGMSTMSSLKTDKIQIPTKLSSKKNKNTVFANIQV